MFGREPRGGWVLIPSLWCIGGGAGILAGAVGITGIGEDGGDKINLSNALAFCTSRYLMVTILIFSPLGNWY